MAVDVGSELIPRNGAAQQSLAVAAAKNLATTTKTPPQMQEITSRWLLRLLPWVNVSGGTYRVNRRLTYRAGGGRIEVVQTGSSVRVIPTALSEFPALAGYDDLDVLEALAGKFTQRQIDAGSTLVESGSAIDKAYVIAHGRFTARGEGKFGGEVHQGVLADGDFLGAEVLADEESEWGRTVTADTASTVLVLSRADYRALLGQSSSLQEQLSNHLNRSTQPTNRSGEARIQLASGHEGEQPLPATFVDYDASPREYQLSVAQTVLRVHSRVADLYNDPMDQIAHQLKLTVEALRERQDHEMINNSDFGLLANVDYGQRINTQSGPPTPDDLDDLLSRRRDNKFFLAHPKAIAAFARECNKRGLYPTSTDMAGNKIPAWRDVPIFPCSKIPITAEGTTSILVLRTGEDNQGVVGLHQVGIPDEYEPGLNVRFMGINETAVISYLVSAYYSLAILVPDAVGMLENVEIGHR